MRLAPLGPHGLLTLLVASAHLLHPDAGEEYRTGHSPRVAQVGAALRALRSVARPREATLLMGDLNDAMHPRWHLRGAGLVDTFTALGVTPMPTFPAHPLASWDLMHRRRRPNPSAPLPSRASTFRARAMACFERS